MNTVMSTRQITKGATTPYVKMNKKIRELRIKEGLTQQQFADILKVSVSMVKWYDRGGCTYTIDAIKRTKKYFKVSYEFLMD